MRLFSALTLTFAMSLSQCTGAADLGKLSEIRPLYGAFFKPGLPMPVSVDLLAPASGFQGMLELWLDGNSSGHMIASAKIDAPPGSARFWLYPRAGSASASALIAQLDGQEFFRLPMTLSKSVVMKLAGKRPESMPIGSAEETFLWPQAFFPGEDPAAPTPSAALASRAPWWCGLVAGQNSGLTAELLKDAGFYPALFSSTALFPDRWYGYQALDVLFWDAGFAPEVSESQGQAIVEWVQGGGRLVAIASETNVAASAVMPAFLRDKPFAQDAVSTPVNGMRFHDRRVGLGLVRLAICEDKSLSRLKEQEWLVLADLPRVAIQARSYGEPGNLEMLRKLLSSGLPAAKKFWWNNPQFLIAVALILGLLVQTSVLLFRRRQTLPGFLSLAIVLASLLACALVFAASAPRDLRTTIEIRDIGPDGSGKTTKITSLRKTGKAEHELRAAYNTSFSLLPPESAARLSEAGSLMRDVGYGVHTKQVIITEHTTPDVQFIEETPFAGNSLQIPARLEVREGELCGSLDAAAIAGYTNVFVVYGNMLRGVSPDGLFSGDNRRIEELMHIPESLRQTAPVSAVPFVDAVTEWLDLASEAALCSDGRLGFEGARTALLPNDWMARWNASSDQAVIFAFRQEQCGAAGTRRILAVRQLTPIAP